MNRLDTIRRQLNLQQYVVYLGFLAIFLFFAVTLADDGFLTTRNLTNIVLQTAPATIMAIGFVFVLSAGEIDLSFGSITAVSALSAAVVMQDMPMLAGVIAGLGAGLLIGCFNGVLVAYLRLPSFLVTLATLGLFAGLARSMTDLRSIPVINDAFTGFFGSGSLFGIPSLILWTLGAVIVDHRCFSALGGCRDAGHADACRGHSRARRRPFNRLFQWSAGCLSEASVLSRHSRDARLVCRAGPIDDGSALHSRDQ